MFVDSSLLNIRISSGSTFFEFDLLMQLEFLDLERMSANYSQMDSFASHGSLVAHICLCCFPAKG